MKARASKAKAQPKTRTIQPKAKGQRKITYTPGGLHASTGTAKGQKIPASKRRAARAGKLGPKAQKQELMAENVFHHPLS
jgi:hypothetical protein